MAVFGSGGGGDWSTTWGIVNKVKAVLISGNTAFFVFISGFLFYPIFYCRGFDYKRFIKGKTLKVLLPWILIVGIFTVYRATHDFNSFSVDFVIFNCAFYWSFWYVPFIMTLFCMSSLHIKFIEASTKVQIITIVLSAIFSMCLGRHNVNPVLSVLFWNTFYIFGIFCAIHYERITNSSATNRHALYSITFLFLGIVVAIEGMPWFREYGVYDIKFGEKIELLVIAKMLLCVVFIYFFKWFNENVGVFWKYLLNALAKYSFSIFFLHQFAIYNLERHPRKWFFQGQNFWEIQLSALLITIIVCILCIALAAVVKKMSGKYSRMIIGA